MKLQKYKIKSLYGNNSYDIDKAYIMGLSFDGNGKYVGWSTLFDHSTLATLEASEWLPYPKKILFNKVEQGYSINNYKNLRKDLTNKIHQWQDQLKQEGLSEDQQQKLYTNINDATNQLSNFGLDINNDILNIQTLENSIEADQNRINEINSTIRTIPQEQRDQILQEKDMLQQRIENIRVQRMNALATLLNNINSVTNKVEDRFRVNLYYTIPNANKVIQELRDHEFTSIPIGLQEQASKNFISSHIQNTIQDLSNMVKAYSPVEMEDLRDASDLSTKGEQAAKMTMLNPATKMLMQYANMTGKNVIGIGANGIKATFMWTYYLNEIVRNNPTERDLKYATFSFNLNRVVGRADNKVRSVEINTLPGVNFNGTDPQLRARFGNVLEGPVSTDNMQSQFLSAATDNAKELILAKINAGNKLAKMYLFLMSLGVDVRDIVKFMTSDVASFIDQITEENMYDNYRVSIYAAIDMARGNFSNYVKTYGKEVIEEIKELYNEYGLGTQEKKNDAIRDADEFKNILEGADEFSRFGQLLGMNQGLATSETDLRKDLTKIQNIVSSRLKEVENVPQDVVEKLSQPIDVARWASDANYRDELKELYNRIKKCVNIFDAFDRISQFDAIRQIFDAIITIDDNLTIKTKAYIKLLDKARKDDLTLPDKYSVRLLRAVDYAIISNFISSLDIKIPVVKGSTNLSSDAEILKFAEDGEIPIKTKSGAATFKYIFENVIIPKLQEGITQDYVNGKVEETSHPELLTNPFVQSLLKASYRDVPLYKANLNMLTIENSTESQRKYNLYTKGLQELSNIFINGTSVSDLFMLYNLIVNKNQYGADRLTTLFDKIVANNQDSLLKDYFKYLGDLDFFGEVILDTDPQPDNDYYKTLEAKNLLLKIGYKDSLITAANIVSSTVGQRDPYIKVNTEKGTVLMQKNERSYEEVKDFIRQKKGEDSDHYFSRVVNYNSYFVLGESFSDNLTKELREITNFGENAINYINDFIQQGILTINKVCE